MGFLVIAGCEADGDFVVGDLVGGDFVGDLAGIFSAMSRIGAAADRFTGVRGVVFDADDDATGLMGFAFDFGESALFAAEFWRELEINLIFFVITRNVMNFHEFS